MNTKSVQARLTALETEAAELRKLIGGGETPVPIDNGGTPAAGGNPAAITEIQGRLSKLETDLATLRGATMDPNVIAEHMAKTDNNTKGLGRVVGRILDALGDDTGAELYDGAAKDAAESKSGTWTGSGA